MAKGAHEWGRGKARERYAEGGGIRSAYKRSPLESMDISAGGPRGKINSDFAKNMSDASGSMAKSNRSEPVSLGIASGLAASTPANKDEGVKRAGEDEE